MKDTFDEPRCAFPGCGLPDEIEHDARHDGCGFDPPCNSIRCHSFVPPQDVPAGVEDTIQKSAQRIASTSGNDTASEVRGPGGESGILGRNNPDHSKATEDAAEQAYRRIWTRENKKDADALWIEINRGRNLCAKAAEQMTKDGAEIERLRAENTSLKVEIENLKDDLNIHPRFREDV